ncbi:MAG TPA: pyridoxal kinase PdxY [Stellaceae bacterium]|nr:pyridoxal kinase PdxY [Stellaceae bacterium]
MAILSIQSAVAYGSVGNAAAVFPLQRLGFEVWRVDTVLFSNHTGYDAWRGTVLDPKLVGEILRGIEERGALPGCEAVLSGYLGSVELGSVVLDGVRRVKQANPRALYCCDPVLGDADRGFFVRPALADFFRAEAVALADILTPNRFELETLTGLRVDTLAAARAACDALLARGPRAVLVTSLDGAEIATETTALLAATREGGWLVRTPRLPIVANGAGDLTAALFLAHFLETGTAGAALGETAAGVHAVIAETVRRGAAELAIVAAQDALLAPPQRFPVERVF